MQQQICIEVLFMTVLTWVCIWGILEEFLVLVTDTKKKILVYVVLLVGTLILAFKGDHLSVCALL